MRDINTALGMVSERPLQVGDWVALIDPQPEGLSQLTTDLLCKLEWPRRVTSIANPNAAFVDGFSYCCDRSRFRRVDPPRDEVAELREQVRILNEICDDIRGTFWYSRDGIVDLATYVAQDYAELRCQLATARAESAAMREAFSKRVSFGCHFWKGVNDTYIRFNDREKSLAAEHAIGSFLQGTAGRELLDELKAKDERIRELQADAKANKQNTLATAELLHHMAKDIERKRKKCYTAKLSTLRGKIDPAWFGDQPSPDSVWQYRKRDGYGRTLYRYNGKVFQASFGHGDWSDSNKYRNWKQCCDDLATYPCDENGKRISDGGAK